MISKNFPPKNQKKLSQTDIIVDKCIGKKNDQKRILFRFKNCSRQLRSIAFKNGEHFALGYSNVSLNIAKYG